jgi:hypothetical protein
MDELEVHDNFTAKMAEKFPRYFGEGKHYGGFAIGAGWYPIIESLMIQIHHYTKWKRNMRARDLKNVRAGDVSIAVTPKVNWIEVNQIKEKFGCLRFYYSGGDDEISGMVRMAEVWADHSCETCGERGKRRSGGWIRTLCDKHEALYQVSKGNYNG